MADSDLLVTISGAALSLLCYENVRSIGDQMGFLLGETLEFVVKSYTDSENQIETIKIHNNIETVVTCPLPDLLHDSTGRINKEKLKDFVRDKSKQVIGWFRFRRNAFLVPTMRDRILHKEFASHFSGGNGSKEEFFVTCLLNTSLSNERGTHKFKHVFLRRRRGLFEPVPLRISNLGNDSFRHDGSDYKPAPTKKLSSTPDVFTKLIESLHLDLTKIAGFESAITIQKAAEQHLNELIPKVCESDLEVAELEKQIYELRTNISMRKLNKKIKVNGNTNTLSRKSEIEKISATDEGLTQEKVPPSRMASGDNVCDSTRTLKDHSTATSPACSIHKTRNTALSIEKNVNQCKLRRMDADTLNIQSQQPFVNTVSEMKVDVTDSTSKRNRRSPGMVSEIDKESICKGVEHENGVGRGKSRLSHDVHIGLKNARCASGPIATRSNSERNPYTLLSEQESSEGKCIQIPPRQLSYSQTTRKNADNIRNISDTSDNH